MTAIAYDGKAIASDRRATWDNEPCPHPESKLSLFSFNGRRFIVGRSGGQVHRPRAEDGSRCDNQTYPGA